MKHARSDVAPWFSSRGGRGRLRRMVLTCGASRELLEYFSARQDARESRLTDELEGFCDG